MKGIGGHHRAFRGATDVWLTPPELIKALGPFDIDPCAAPEPRPWKTAHVMWSPPTDGLAMAWGGRIWMNPPYGPQTGKWLKKLADHGNGMALIFARTETAMFFEQVWNRADAILFFAGRLFFCYPDGRKASANAGGPSCLIAYGQNKVDVLNSVSELGKVVVLSGDGGYSTREYTHGEKEGDHDGK